MRNLKNDHAGAGFYIKLFGFKFLMFTASVSSLAYAGEDLSQKYWSLGWSKKATVISQENVNTYIRVIPVGDVMQLAYIVSGEGACPQGKSNFKTQGEANGKKLSFSGKCEDEYYKELIPETDADHFILKKEFLSSKSVLVKIDQLPKRTFTAPRFISVAKSAGLDFGK